MLSIKNRLQKEKDIKNVLKNGKSSFSKHLGVKYIQNDLDSSRFAFIISLKISKKAVKRNRLKRQLREIIRLDLKKIKKGIDIIILTRPGILDLGYNDLKKELLSVFKKSKLI